MLSFNSMGMEDHMRYFPTSLVTIGALVYFCGTAHSQDVTSDAYAARDICVGVGAQFANAPKGTTITFNSGKFKVEKGADGQITVFENAVPVANIPSFDYKNYTECIEKTTKGFEARRNRTELKKVLTIFEVGYELNQILNFGVCMQPIAQAGVYFGEINSEVGRPVDFSKFLESFSGIMSSRIGRLGDRNSSNEGDVAFKLNDEVSFYRYVPGREMPYFDTSSIARINSQVLFHLDSDFEDYALLGFRAGTLARVYRMYAGMLGLQQWLSDRFDPRSMAVKQASISALQCLGRVYGEEAVQLNAKLDELSVPSNISLPDLRELHRMNQQQLNLQNFDALFTSKLKIYIRRIA